jgi:hypothetical protein
MVICDKERRKANEIANMTVIGDVEGKDIVLIDDIIDTGGTLCKAAQMLTEKGARTVRALCCHPVLSGKAYENIQNSVLTELVVTDTIPLKQHIDKIKILSVAPLFARAIRNVHENGSISSLFKAMPEVSNITAFNTDPFNTWKSAFRECCKLSSKIIDRQDDVETQQRLEAWCTLNESAPYGAHAYMGAIAGKYFGLFWQNAPTELAKINDFDWLKEQYEMSKDKLNG